MQCKAREVQEQWDKEKLRYSWVRGGSWGLPVNTCEASAGFTRLRPPGVSLASIFVVTLTPPLPEQRREVQNTHKPMSVQNNVFVKKYRNTTQRSSISGWISCYKTLLHVTSLWRTLGNMIGAAAWETPFVANSWMFQTYSHGRIKTLRGNTNGQQFTGNWWILDVHHSLCPIYRFIMRHLNCAYTLLSWDFDTLNWVLLFRVLGM